MLNDYDVVLDIDEKPVVRPPSPDLVKEFLVVEK